MTKTSSVLLAAMSACAFVASGCGGGGSGPRIRSFEASSTSIPEGGVPVTFTWDVSGEDSLTLAPAPGAVSGTSATVVVTEPTTFTLTAKNENGRDRSRLTIQVGEPVTVSGTLLDSTGAPVPGMTVLVDGELTVTNLDGSFELENVVLPYDLGYVDDGGGSVPAFGFPGYQVVVWRGVTRLDPVLLYEGEQPPEHFSTFSGSVTGGLGFPQGTWETRLWSNLAYSPETQYGLDGSDGSFDAGIGWRGPDPVSYTLNALQYEVTGLEYTHHGRVTGTIEDGVVETVDVPLVEIDSGIVTGTIPGLPPVGGAAVIGAMEIAPGNDAAGGRGYPARELVPLSRFGSVSTAGAFTLQVPGIPGATVDLLVEFSDEESDPNWYSSVQLLRVPQGATDLDVPVQEAAWLLTPVDDAEVSLETAFTTQPVPGTVTRHSFETGGPTFGLGGPGNVNLVVYTDAAVLELPDVREIGVPLFDAQLTWYVESLGPFATVDEALADALFVPGTTATYATRYDDRTLLFRPDPDSRGPIISLEIP